MYQLFDTKSVHGWMRNVVSCKRKENLHIRNSFNLQFKTFASAEKPQFPHVHVGGGEKQPIIGPRIDPTCPPKLSPICISGNAWEEGILISTTVIRITLHRYARHLTPTYTHTRTHLIHDGNSSQNWSGLITNVF